MQFEQKRLDLLNKYKSLQDNEIDFNSLALSLFSFQKEHNAIYQRYLSSLGKIRCTPKNWTDIPCLPIQAFKQYRIQTGSDWTTEKIFLSSGTGGVQSQHHIRDVEFYIQNATSLFERYIGPVESYCYLALLPGYIDRQGSSLIEMVQAFISMSKYSESDFYLSDLDTLLNTIKQCVQQNIPIILFGVSFALLDFIETYKPDLSQVLIIETGGMKSKNKELSKREILNRLQKASKCKAIYSEYGMTELQSQAYALDGLNFKESKQMKVFVTDINDPFSLVKPKKAGQLNVIDLANIDSCAFIQTEDLAKKNDNTSFEILGRLHQSDLRGCNLLLDEV